MVVVSRLCTKVEPTDTELPGTVESLSNLLRSEDTCVADAALKCFASLADRFIRKNQDPKPLTGKKRKYIQYTPSILTLHLFFRVWSGI